MTNKTGQNWKRYVGIPVLNAIKQKVWSDKKEGMDAYVGPISPFRYKDKTFTGRTDVLAGAFQKSPGLYNTEKKKGDISVLGLDVKGKRVYRYASKTMFIESKIIDAYKVFVPKANGSGALGEVVTYPSYWYPSYWYPSYDMHGDFFDYWRIRYQK